MHKFTIPEDPITLQTLWDSHRALSMEGFAQDFASLTAVTNLRSMFTNGKKFVTDWLKKRDETVYPKVFDDLDTIFSNNAYSDLIGYRAFIPNGLNTPMSDYVVALTQSLDSVIGTILPDLDKLTVTCAKAVNDVNFRRSSGMAQTLPKNDPENVLETLRAMFKQGTVTQTTVGRAYKNEDDIRQIGKDLDASRIRALDVNPKDVKKAIERFMEVADRLTEILVQDYNEGAVSNAMIRDISDAIYQTAKQAELYAFLVNALAEAIIAYNDTWDAVKKNAKK